MPIHIDFETRSAVDLKNCGVDVYANDETTDVLCMAYAIDDGEIKLWKLGQDFPTELLEYLELGARFLAHNAAFEHRIWNFVCTPKYGWPPLPLSQLFCTMVQAYAMGLPGALENASKAVGLKTEKDMKGNRVMLQLAQPREIAPSGAITWWDIKDSTPELDIKDKYETLYRYCIQDVIVERALDKRLLPLSKSERQLWLLDQKINHAGVYVDIENAKKALDMVEIEKIRLNKKMQDATNNEVATCQAHLQLKTFINSHNIYGEQVYKSGPRKGEKKVCDGVGKDLVKDMLEMDLPFSVKEALLIRQEAAKSSTAKLKKMISGASLDKRVRGCFQFYGAASTGRWAGRRIQLQNMPRPTIRQIEIEEIIGHIENDKDARDIIDVFYGSPMNRIADCLRGFLCASPGNRLIACDFSSIEARVLAWLAGEDNILNVFRGHGLIYEHAASRIFNVPFNKVTKDQRLIGKVATLALGYQGGVGAFQSMAKVYLIKIADEKADQIKVAWRNANPRIVRYWYQIENCAITAVENPGRVFSLGHKNREVSFLKKGSFLFCRLPSGRAICYPYPKIKQVETPWGEMKNALTYKGDENYKFVEKVAYGGLITENVTQAVARDLLAEAMKRVDKKGYKIIMHVHDEIVCEVPNGGGSLDQLEKLMCQLPKWAKDLPIAASGWVGERFRK